VRPALALLFLLVALQSCSPQRAQIKAIPDLPVALNDQALDPSGIVLAIEYDSVKRADTYQINGQAIRAQDIYREFASYFDGSQRGVIIEAAQNAHLESVVTGIDAALSAGFTRIGLANGILGGMDGAIAGFQEVKKPSCQSCPDLMDDRIAIFVEVSKADQVRIDGQNVSNASIYVVIKRSVAFHAARVDKGYSRRIFVVAELDSHWKTIIEVLDAAHQAGDDDVFITMTDPKKNSSYVAPLEPARP
jgi:biopolymer transport protein ExbD